MIQFVNVFKQFGDTQALSDINFQIAKGSFVYLIGPTGSGKTTIFRLIQRDLLPSDGSIIVGEWDIAKLPKGKVPHLRRKVGVIFQDLKLLMDRTILENVILPLIFAGSKEAEARRKAEELLIGVGLVDKMNQFPLQLSGGERQRVAVARALIFDPEVILADEPTGNLDLQTSYQILDLLKHISTQRGTTILMATHNNEFIKQATERILVMEKGRLVEDRTPKEKHSKKEKAG